MHVIVASTPAAAAAAGDELATSAICQQLSKCRVVVVVVAIDRLFTFCPRTAQLMYVDRQLSGQFIQRAAMLALQALYTSYGNSVRPSVCLFVTRRYCVKTTAYSTVQFALSDSNMCLVL